MTKAKPKSAIAKGLAEPETCVKPDVPHDIVQAGGDRAVPQPEPRQEARVTQIIGMHERAQRSARDALESAKVCGELLLEAKATVGHGGWSAWLAKNIPFSERTAQRYMKLAEGWERLQAKSDTLSDLTVTGALTALRLPRAPREKPTEEPTEEPTEAASPPKGKRQSRVARWSEASQQAIDAIEQLVAMQEEFQEWRDNLPENLASSPLADKLDAVIGIDLQGALEAMNEAADADLPRGFGRD